MSVLHVNGTEFYDLSINGAAALTVDGLADATSHSTNFVNMFTLNQTGPTTVYWDAAVIPEPSSSALLLGIGAVMFLSRRKIRR